MTKRGPLVGLGSALFLCSLILAACGDSATPSGSAPTASGSNPTALKGGSTAVPNIQPTGKPVANGGAMNACGLITQAEASAALGQAVGPAKPSNGGGGSSDCEYKSQTSETSVVSISLSSSSVQEFAMLKKMTGAIDTAVPSIAGGLVTSLPSLLGGSDGVPHVAGLGDDAFWTGGITNTMFVLIGNKMFSIQLLNFSVSSLSLIPSFDASKALAQVAAARLTGAPVPAITIVAAATPTPAPDMATAAAALTAMSNATPDTGAQTEMAGGAATLAAGMTDMPGSMTTAAAVLTAIGGAMPAGDATTAPDATTADETPTP